MFIRILLLGSALLLPTLVRAEQPQCLQLSSRIEACPNLVYRAIDDPKDGQRRLFCFCKTDFDLLMKRDVTDQQRIANNMEWRQLSAETGFSVEQLKNIVNQ